MRGSHEGILVNRVNSNRTAGQALTTGDCSCCGEAWTECNPILRSRSAGQQRQTFKVHLQSRAGLRTSFHAVHGKQFRDHKDNCSSFQSTKPRSRRRARCSSSAETRCARSKPKRSMNCASSNA
jgi:hypothetical protein